MSFAGNCKCILNRTHGTKESTVDGRNRAIGVTESQQPNKNPTAHGPKAPTFLGVPPLQSAVFILNSTPRFTFWRVSICILEAEIILGVLYRKGGTPKKVGALGGQSSPESSAKSLSHKFFGVPCLSLRIASESYRRDSNC